MPKKADYSKGKIYGIYNKTTGIVVYTGSTVQTLCARYARHRTRINNTNDKKYNYPIYQHIRANGGDGNFEIRLIENYPCVDITELNRREGEIQKQYDTLMNKTQAGRTHQESVKNWAKNNKEKRNDDSKKFRETHREKIANNRAEKVECDNCHIMVSRSSLWYHKKTDRCKKLSDKQTRCDCGGVYSHRGKSRHLKTDKHKKYIDSINA